MTPATDPAPDDAAPAARPSPDQQPADPPLADRPAFDRPSTDRDVAIIADVVRDRVTAAEIVRRRHFPDAGPDAARKVLERLVAGRWLRKIPLYRKTPGYILAYPAAHRLGLHRVAARPPARAALCRAYGLAWYCLEVGVRRFSPAEWRAQFPELHRPGLPAAGYHLEATAQGPGVVYVHVDTAQDVRRLLKKIRRAVARRFELPAFQDLVRAGRFAVAIATPSDGKRQTIEDVFGRKFRAAVPVRVVVVPELELVLTGGRGRP